SPTTGTQPGAPNWKGAISGAPGPFVFLRYQVAVAGSKAPMVTTPSPSQSPTSGIQPGAPKANGAVLGAPGTLLSRRYQVALSGSKTPTVASPAGVTGGPIGVTGGVIGGGIGVIGTTGAVTAIVTSRVSVTRVSNGSRTRTVTVWVPASAAVGTHVSSPVVGWIVILAGTFPSSEYSSRLPAAAAARGTVTLRAS